MPKMVELRFRAAEGVDVHHPLSLLAGRSHVIGKTWDAESESYKLNADPEHIRMTAEQWVFWSAMLSKCVRGGELQCADQATAERFGVQFKAETKSAPKRAEG